MAVAVTPGPAVEPPELGEASATTEGGPGKSDHGGGGGAAAAASSAASGPAAPPGPEDGAELSAESRERKRREALEKAAAAMEISYADDSEMTVISHRRSRSGSTDRLAELRKQHGFSNGGVRSDKMQPLRNGQKARSRAEPAPATKSSTCAII